jgi:hypothetical protein
MSQLFAANGVLEVVEHLGDGVQGVSCLELGLDLNHDLHDVSVGNHIDSVLLKQINIEC